MTMTEEELLAQPDAEHDLEAWYMDDSEEDQRKEHKRTPNEPVSLAKLRELGVLSWHLDADNHKTDPKLAAIRKVRGYTYEDVVRVSPEFLPNYEATLKKFYEEHLHADEEIRFLLEGSGYFDVRDEADQWIRIAMKKGDMIVLPAGIYHRFTLDEKNCGTAMRLFVGEPVWTPYPRPCDEHEARKDYVDRFIKPAVSVA